MPQLSLSPPRLCRRSRPRPGAGALRVLRGYQRLCVLAFVSELIAVVALPGAHLARHRPDHHHRADGHIERFEVAAVRAELPAGYHVAVSIGATTPAHGDGGRYHFQASVLPACVLVVPPPAVLRLPLDPSWRTAQVTARDAHGAWQSRGPPSCAARADGPSAHA